MLSFKSVLFFACIAFVAAHPVFFRVAGENRERNPEEENPLKNGNSPMDQIAFPSYDYGGEDAGGEGAGGGTTDAESDSAEDNDAGNTAEETDDSDADGSELEAAENEAAENAAGDSPDAAAAGGNSGADSPTNLGGNPGQHASKGEKSMAGRNVGIAFAVVAAVGLAVGCGYYVFRKRRAAAYGARF